MRSSVVLPAPFGPSRAVIPGKMLNETSLMATTLPNHRETRSTLIVGVVAAPRGHRPIAR